MHTTNKNMTSEGLAVYAQLCIGTSQDTADLWGTYGGLIAKDVTLHTWVMTLPAGWRSVIDWICG